MTIEELHTKLGELNTRRAAALADAASCRDQIENAPTVIGRIAMRNRCEASETMANDLATQIEAVTQQIEATGGGQGT